MSRYAEAHKPENLKGPGDARPTALQIISDESLIGKLTDKVCLVTGTSSGIGIETMRALHATGAHVIGTVRNVDKGQEVINEILSQKVESGGKLDVVQIELDNFASIREGAQQVLEKSGGQLNIMVDNAGVMACPKGFTKDGFETQFGTNHLGHFLLFQLLKDTLLKSASPNFPSRVVSVTSLGHKFGSVRFEDINFEKEEYDPWVAYAQAKTANIWFANAIERLFGSQNLHATAVHPGGILTNLGRHITPNDPIFEMVSSPEWQKTYKSPEQGAATQVWAAVSEEWKNKGGRYLSDMHETEALGVRKELGDKDDGYAPWVYNQEDEEKLWNESLKWVGMSTA